MTAKRKARTDNLVRLDSLNPGDRFIFRAYAVDAEPIVTFCGEFVRMHDNPEYCVVAVDGESKLWAEPADWPVEKIGGKDAK